MLKNVFLYGVVAAFFAAGSQARAESGTRDGDRDSMGRPPALACSSEVLRGQVGLPVSLTGVTDTGGICVVTGTVATDGEGAGPGAARFALRLPRRWNGRFLFLGGSGFDGFVPNTPAALLAKGYATLATDSGHVGQADYFPGVDATWTVTAPGVRDEAKFADYATRARYHVNTALRPLVPAFYGDAPVARAYFVGCSNGGREALMEAQNHPQDYDGFVAGNPFVGAEHMTLHARNARALLAAPIPFAKFPAISAAVMAACDAEDGVRDGLIQNPARCDFDPKSLSADGTLTPAEADALVAYLSVPRDSRGRSVGYANAVSGMGDLFPSPEKLAGGLTGLSAYLGEDTRAASAGFPWGRMPAGPIDWQLATGAFGSLAYRENGMSLLDPRLTRPGGTVEAEAVDRLRAALAPMMPDPARMGPFFASGRKLIVYHGFDDTILNPYATMDTYRRMAEVGGGLARTQASARLFMAPGMGHCALGSGPNTFDPLSALESWVERGTAPDMIPAAHYPGTPGEGRPDRTMPLCPYPQVARYDGHGPVATAQSWHCENGEDDLRHSGPAGLRAGWSGQ